MMKLKSQKALSSTHAQKTLIHIYYSLKHKLRAGAGAHWKKFGFDAVLGLGKVPLHDVETFQGDHQKVDKKYLGSDFQNY